MTIIRRFARERWAPPNENSRPDPYVDRVDEPYIPGQRYERKFEAHDAETRVLIEQWKTLGGLPHGASLVERLSKWSWLDRMASPEEKQRYLEPLINAVRKDPGAHEDKLVFLLVVCEPIRRSVSKEFIAARQGLEPKQGTVASHRREEAARLRHIEMQELFDVTRNAVLEALFRYPSPSPKHFFPWLRETVAHRALDSLRGELPSLEACDWAAAEAEAMQDFLAGFEEATQPTMREPIGLRSWRAQISVRSVFGVVEDYYEHGAVRQVCMEAVGRLPQRQQEVITEYFFAGTPVDEIAARRGVSESTIYNHKAQAQSSLRDDDLFFAGLHTLGMVRDRVRAKEISLRYPDGRLPDGRRIVSIEIAA